MNDTARPATNTKLRALFTWRKTVMRLPALLCIGFASAFAALLQGTAAHAQSRVFVAAQGSDGNPCTFAAPCRTFQHAHDVVAANGEIDVLDPAGYGQLTISKAISIQGHGFAGISVLSGSAITISAGASDQVFLNGILIDGGGTGNSGIRYTSGLSLVVENCVVRNMSFNGLDFRSSATTTVKLSVSGSSFTENAFNGIIIAANNTGAVIASVQRVTLQDNALTGLVVTNDSGHGPLDVMVSDTVAANGADSTNGEGVSVLAGGSNIHLTLSRVTMSGNNVGVTLSGEPASAWLEQCTITGNTMGYKSVDGAVINTYGDNYIHANGSNSGNLSSVSKQ
jgi:hypothetical protein